MSGGYRSDDDSYILYRKIVGFAIAHYWLPNPTGFSPNYRVLTDCDGDHVYSFSDGVAAGAQYGALAQKGCSTAILTSDGKVVEANKDLKTDVPLQQAFGWNYLCTTHFESC
jgi:hypothetical protein